MVAAQSGPEELLPGELDLIKKYGPKIAGLSKVFSKFHEGGFKGKELRPQHAKILAGFTNATFRVDKELPADLKTEWLKPDASYDVDVRFSNASGIYFEHDQVPDLRGIALRLHIDDTQTQDLLLTNAKVHHAKDAKQALASSAVPQHKSAPARLSYLTRQIGLIQALRIARHIKKQTKIPVADLASETFHSRGAYRVNKQFIRFRLEPTIIKPIGNDLKGNDKLGDKLRHTLDERDVVYQFQIQRFVDVDKEQTPLELGTADWKVPFETIAELVIPKNSADKSRQDEERQKAEEKVDAIRFNPFNPSNDQSFMPVGPLNRIRNPVYRQSQAGRL